MLVCVGGEALHMLGATCQALPCFHRLNHFIFMRPTRDPGEVGSATRMRILTQ